MKQLAFAVLVIAMPCVSYAKGPTGIGDLKIGQSMTQIEALPTGGAVYLNAPMTPYVYKESKPTPGEDRFDTALKTPWSDEPMKAVLTFKEGALTRINVTLPDSTSTSDTIREQIASKYGEPTVEDKTKEEQCLYKNGANFKLKSGFVTYSWLETPPTGTPIEATILQGALDFCPVNLRYGSTGGVKINTLTIGHQRPKPPAAANPF